VPSNVASLSSANSIPDSRIGGFTTEARGTCQTTEVVDVSQSVTGASSQPAMQPTSAEGASGEDKPQTLLIKPQRFDGSQSLEMFLLQFEQLVEHAMGRASTLQPPLNQFGGISRSGAVGAAEDRSVDGGR